MDKGLLPLSLGSVLDSIRQFVTPLWWLLEIDIYVENDDDKILTTYGTEVP